MAHRSCVLLLSSFLLLGLPAAPAAGGTRVPYPKDPFAKSYEPPRAREMGTTAGQFRAVGALGPLYSGSTQFAFQGTLELMTFAYIGMRGTMHVAATKRGDDPRMVALRVGPSLHFLPYSRFDVSLFLEGGIAFVDPFESTSTATPVVVPGLAFHLAISTYWFLQFEGHLCWGLYRRGPGAERYLGAAALFGIGFGI